MSIEEAEYAFTGYFENRVLRKRPYLKKIWCIRICNNPLKVEPQFVYFPLGFANGSSFKGALLIQDHALLV
uniref:Uncharacterized protein n=1 Tax=Candidatus Kentrum sp. FM TaxID=2126340 RepID=A0A450SRM2_9GAMM|nr:MAG: hypothetical protein BECKFM1743A_GA0114220_101735 [Candidatus Kentron sp. FM]VFJ57775.1 MAG: hypothetical protein BECKFM1743C_GA0114222_102085 [Candidatus Kentron sp. FM]VFK11725.1 MAG: hypothetical protein BECKFM1743B_GA0114221_102034 [Candidatus Kentron sp. FM]